MFKEVPTDYDFPGAEREIIEFWKDRRIFEKSLELRRGGPSFVFYEGPPTANGKPHPGHVLTRVIKDVFPRYKSMCGCSVPRKAGWDTHGLPVETEVEKELGINGKDQIESYGVERFVRNCMESVFRYTGLWEKLTERIGFWIDMSDPYATYHDYYVESVWWALSELWKKGLLYQGHKIVPYCPRCGTPLSSHEVGLGYKEVDDPSVTVRFRVKGGNNLSFLAWTTTPWTLISNAALVVRPEFDYSYVESEGEVFILASRLVEAVLGDRARKIVKTVKGRDLEGIEYEPLYLFEVPKEKAHYVICADFVTLDAGTGVVHSAPAFGEDDYASGKRHNLPVIQLVDERGCFKEAVAPWKGRFVKEADGDILEELDARGLIFARGKCKHEYPFCWRCDSPLIYYARDSWFIRTTEFVRRMLENNGAVAWYPEHIKGGRFGKFLESNVDWALSRERYWGTPLPIWRCELCGRTECIASREELLARSPGAFDEFERRRKKDPSLPKELAIHKPYIDGIAYPCGRCKGTMRRVGEVVDCWFDSGCMPFAQWGWPYAGRGEFKAAFPADFISEAIDQTRGWFYSLLAISTMLFEEAPPPHPYRSCMVLGHVCDEQGYKMSKSKRNYLDPWEVIEENGADALRWYFLSSQPPHMSIRFFKRAVTEAQRDFLIRLWNVYSFFVIYANIDRFDPAADAGARRGVPERPMLDRWMIALVNLSAGRVRSSLDGYDVYGAARSLDGLVDALSNWYVRRSRERFWKSQRDQDKLDGYWTLYEALVAIAKLAAPFVPFATEAIYGNLVAGPFEGREPESVHLCDYPAPEESAIDMELVGKMDLTLEVAKLGRAVRNSAKIKTRQPLEEAVVILADPARASGAPVDLIAEELNVKSVKFASDAERYVTFSLVPNYKLLGPRLGAKVQKVRAALAGLDASELRGQMLRTGGVSISLDGERIDLTREEIEVRLAAREHYAAMQGAGAVVVLNTDLTDELVAEGKLNDLVSAVQNARKEKNLAYEARIALTIGAPGRLKEIVRAYEGSIAEATLSVRIDLADFDESADWTRTVEIDGETAGIRIREVAR